MAPRAWGLPLLAAILLATGFWAWLGRAVPLPPAPEPRLHCVSYTPFRGAQSPYDPTLVIPPAQIEEDLDLLQPVTGCVRIYATDQGLDQVVPLAAARGMQVLLGAWISSRPELYLPQVEKVIALANAYPGTVKAIIVGNEVLLRGEQSGETLAELVMRVKAATSVPVTYADVWGFWQKAPQVLVDAVDFITIHILPYWEDDPLPSAGGTAHVEEVLGLMARQFPGRRVMIGETGWPSAGREREDAVPSIVDQARYLREFLVFARAHDIDYNFIEAFDQPWKRQQEGAVGGYWGVFDSERQAKFDWFGPVSNHPRWPLLDLAAIVTGLAALALARALAGAPAPGGFPARLSLCVAACTGGCLITLQGTRAALIATGGAELALEGLLLLQSFGILVLALGMRGDLGNAPLACATGWLRAPHHAKPPVAALLRLAVLAGAATAGLALCFDGRYRGFPVATYALPAVAFLVLQWRDAALLRPRADGAEERLLSLLLAGCACYIAWNERALDPEAANLQALGFCAVLLALATGIAGAWRRPAVAIAG